MKYNPQVDKVEESFVVAGLLALVGGYLDIYSYLARGRVFANTQTGNLVLLGCNLAEGNWHKVIYYLISILAFIVGIWVAKFIEHKYVTPNNCYWLLVILGLEIIGVFVVMCIPKGDLNVFANAVLSLICALQVQGFRKVNGSAYSTIMFTGNLKNLAERFSEYHISKNKDALSEGWIFLGIILLFIAGGWLGTLTTATYFEKSVGLVNVVLIIVLLLVYFDQRK